MRLAALKRFAESSDTALQRLKSSLFSPVSEISSNLQIVSQISLCSSVFGKLLSLTTTDKELYTFVLKRIFMYAITRILPAVNNKKCINDVAPDNVKLMATYYNAVRKCCCEQTYSSDDLLHEMAKMIDERIAFLSDFCWGYQCECCYYFNGERNWVCCRSKSGSTRHVIFRVNWSDC